MIEFQDDFPVAVWQAHIDGLGEDSIQSLSANKLKDRTGPLPAIDKKLIYYGTGIFGDSSWEESGWVDTEGKYTQTGYKRVVGGSVSDEAGTITMTLPNETRKDR
ncbi:hypothetical protein PAE9249_04100 [Paenibacillus sp. CECT 9249]|nr:hypothetical protein PAE9249_04100 [Paenibacillus sp. CECT 9249]